jgi:zinc protease
MSISCKQDNILGGLIAGVSAVERARQHGFTMTELDRAKKLIMASTERQYNERNDRRNSYFVNRCVNNFLQAEPLISVECDYELTKKFDAEVSLDEVNKAVRELITDKNQVLALYGPDKESVVLPTPDVLRQVIETTQKQPFAAYVEEKLPEQFIASLPAPGNIVSEKAYGNNGFTEFVLSNGMHVYAKATDFAKDAVQMKMKADGGTSVYGNEDIPNFSLVSSAVTEGGVGNFDALSLNKMLTGKVARVRPSVGSKSQSITATSSLKDMRTMFELAHLYFTQPRRDDAAYKGLINRTRSFLTNRNASPKVDYNDSINAILYGHHPRLEPTTQATLDKANYDRILQIYKERFSDASNFNTVIIGNFDMNELKQLMCQYLATLPATNKQEKTNYSNVPKMVPGSSVHTFVKKQATPLANVSIFYSADIDFNAKNDLTLDFLKRVLSIAYTDSVREEKGGTYGVSVNFDFEKDDTPNATMRISYNADPTRYGELNPIIYKQLENIAMNGPVESSMQKVREYLVKQYDQLIIDNDYWDYVIWHEIEDGVDFDRGYKDLVMQTTAADVQAMARKLIDAKRCIEVTMLSE